MGNILSAYNRDLFYGKHEVQVTENEYKLEEAASVCEKQQCHNDMIPVEKFTMEHLPSDCRQEDIFNLVLAIATLTVKLKVTYVSEDRPILIPNTKLPYPLHDRKGSGDCLSSGSGRVCDVMKQTGRWDETCKCSKCKISASPSKSWWIIKIFTATAVVYDGKEANQTSCTFDVGSERGANIFELSGCRKKWSDVEGDLCLLEIESCSQELCDNLFSTIQTFNKLWRRLSHTFKHLNETDERLIVIASYPHGAHKRISIGHGVDAKSILGLNFSKYVYDAPTCPGSAGGPVYALGNDWFKTEYVHSGYCHEISPPENTFVDSKNDSVVDPENISVFFKNTESSRPQSEQIFFTNSSCDNNSEKLAGSEYIPQSQHNIQKYSKYKGYSTRWY